MTPMQIRLRAAGGGEDAVFSFPSGPGYDPRDAGVYAPASPATSTIKAIYEKAPETGLASTILGKLMFPCLALIPALEADACTVLVRGVTYAPSRVRRRIYMGLIDGYSMDLVAGPGGG